MRDNTKAGHPKLPTPQEDEEEESSPSLGFGYYLSRFYSGTSLIGYYDKYERVPKPGLDLEEWWYWREGEVVCYRELSGNRKYQYMRDYETFTGGEPSELHLAYIIFMGALRDW